MIPIQTLAEFLRGNIDLSTGTYRALLLKDTTAYTPDATAHTFVSDVVDNGTTAEEYDDTNYARVDVTGLSVTEDTTDAEAVFDADDLVWSALGSNTGGQTVQAVILYEQVGGDDTTPADDRIIRVWDDSTESALPKQTNGEDFTWEINAEGVLNLTP
ncbi:hypothetical protein ACFR97_10295 [Haloplanus litoreus]|uniref:Uncharacterized protein n=1 Tax=Haloplanus litoreus TaxID=767515 RepID=A0ABD6A1V1_9EURY